MRISTIALILVALALLTMETREDRQARNVAAFDAIQDAEQLRGKPNQVMRIGTFQFKTDAAGEVYMHYADGWFNVNAR